MKWVALFSLAYLCLRFLITFINFLTYPVLRKKNAGFSLPVSVCIPVRNEEKNLPRLLDDILKQDYKNIEIHIYDDLSNDNTWEIIESYKNNYTQIVALKGTELPEGWIGKNYACYQLSKAANGEYIIFIDADVRLNSNAISSLIFLAREKKVDLLSVFPKQLIVTKGELLVVPIMNRILLSLLVLFMVPKRNFASISAANGQLMIFKNVVYQKQDFHKMMADNPVEDIGIARRMKKMKYRIGVYLGGKIVSCRMYNSYSEAINGFSKNVLHFFGNHYLFAGFHAVFSTLGILVTILFLPLIYVIIYSVIFVLKNLFIAVLSGFPVFQTIFYAIPQHFSLIRVLYIAIKTKRSGKFSWKDRIYKI